MNNTLLRVRSDLYLLSPSNRYAHTLNCYDVAINFEPKCTPPDPFPVEFPLLVAGVVYAGGNPGPDRVVYEYVIPTSFSSNLSPHIVFT